MQELEDYIKFDHGLFRSVYYNKVQTNRAECVQWIEKVNAGWDELLATEQEEFDNCKFLVSTTHDYSRLLEKLDFHETKLNKAARVMMMRPVIEEEQIYY